MYLFLYIDFSASFNIFLIRTSAVFFSATPKEMLNGSLLELLRIHPLLILRMIFSASSFEVPGRIIQNSSPPIQTIEDIANGLNIPPEYFLEYRIHKITNLLLENPRLIEPVLSYIETLKEKKKLRVAES